MGAGVFDWYRPEIRGSFGLGTSMRPGLTEILIILGIALLLFGAGRLADVGKGLGEGIRNFKKGLRDDEDEDEDDDQLPEGDDEPKGDD